LDAWIERLQAKYAGFEPGWVLPEAADESASAPAAPSPHLVRMTELVNRAKRWEIQLIETKPELEPVLQAKIDSFQPQTWNEESALMDVLKTALRRNLSTILGDAGAEDMVRAMN